MYMTTPQSAYVHDHTPICLFCCPFHNSHLQKDSKFAKAYNDGLHKSRYWEPCFEDSMDLIAKLPELAAMVYRK